MYKHISEYLVESPEKRALARLEIAVANRDWEIAKEALGILDGHLNRNVPRSAPIPFQPRTINEHARVS
jgi:hypothetical protein